jgi:excinuclease ABC subunit C
MGEAVVASCVVFNPEGPMPADYRRFNIQGIVPGDDYAAIKQALWRRYSRLKESDKLLPDLIMIDGGKGQLTIALTVMEELQVSGVSVLAIAKGVTRKPGLETLYLNHKNDVIILPTDSPALHLLQQIRDEAHRFAITGHKKQREKRRKMSVLQEITGIGAVRRRVLLNYFGGLQELKKASSEQIATVPGISQGLAKRIYDTLHQE